MKINTINFKGAAYTLAGGICWGFSGICSQFLFEEKGISPNWLSPVRLLCAGILLLGYASLTQRESLIECIKNKKDRKQLLLFGVFGLMICQYTYLAAIFHSNAGTATVLQYSGMVMLMLVACVKFRKAPVFNEILALLSAVIGIYLLATQGNPGQLALSAEALFWGIFSAVGLVLYSTLPVRIISRRGSIVVTGYGMIVGGVVLFILLRPWRYKLLLDLSTLIALAAVIIIGTVAAFTLYLKGVSEIGPVKASMLGSSEPVSATVFTVLFMGTKFTGTDIMAFALITVTVFLLANGKKQTGVTNYGNKRYQTYRK